MTELYRHLGEYTDVPAGDIGVGGREIGYLFGQYKRITNRYESGVLTGKGLGWGGVAGADRGDRLRRGATSSTRCSRPGARASTGKRVVVSGSGNVAIYAIEKVQQLGGNVVACSDSAGYVVDENGHRPRRCSSRSRRSSAAGIADYADAARRTRALSSPAAASGTCRARSRCRARRRTSSTGGRAATLVDNGVHRRRRGREHADARPRRVARLPRRRRRLRARARRPTPAAWRPRALEMQQNASRDSWTLRAHRASGSREIMREHPRPLPRDRRGVRRARATTSLGANIAGFVRVADAMLALGII